MISAMNIGCLRLYLIQSEACCMSVIHRIQGKMSIKATEISFSMRFGQIVWFYNLFGLQFVICFLNWRILSPNST